jgi:hypothetical protein
VGFTDCRLLQRKIAYLFRPRLVWAFVAVVAVSFALALWGSEPLLRWWGMVLQLVGVFAVLREIKLAQSEHGLFALWWQGYKEGLLGRRVSMHGIAEAKVEATATFAPRWSKTVVDPYLPIEDRVRTLEKFSSHFVNEFIELNRQLASTQRAALIAVENEGQRREKEFADREAADIASSQNRIPFSLFGAACLFLGVVLATGSPEIWGRLHR